MGKRIRARFIRVLLLSACCAGLPACGKSGGDTFITNIVAPPATLSSLGAVFRADKNRDGILELFAADPIGSLVVSLSGQMVAGASVGPFKISPDRSKVAFIAEKELAVELFVVPALGGAPVKVSGPLIAG